MPLVDDVTPGNLRRLARGREDHGAIVSLIIDLDPTAVPAPGQRESAIVSALTEARAAVERAADGDGADRQRLRRALAALERELVPAGGPVRGARALAAYGPLSDDPEDVEVLRLPEPVRGEVAVGPDARIEPLVGLATAERWCVALVDRSKARFFLGDAHAMEETGGFDDDVHRQHDQGGWSQARYQRSVEEDVHRHLVRVARALQRAVTPHERFEHLLIGAAKPLRPIVEERLHPAVRERLSGWLEIDMSSATLNDIRAVASDAISAKTEARERAALDRLQAGVGRPGGLGVHGWPAVLRALSERRVGELLLHDGRSGDAPAAARCPRCGLLAPEGTATCPADGAALEAVPDAVQAAIAAAYAQDAAVLVLRDEARLETLGGVGAVLRF